MSATSRTSTNPSDYHDAMRAADLHAQLGNAFGEGQALLRAGSVGLLPGDDGGETLLPKAHALLESFGATKTLARCLSAMASSSLLAGGLPAAKLWHAQAMAVAEQIEACQGAGIFHKARDRSAARPPPIGRQRCKSCR
jgi:hypothetical protein